MPMSVTNRLGLPVVLSRNRASTVVRDVGQYADRAVTELRYVRSSVIQGGVGIQSQITLKERNRSQANTLAQILITPKPLAFRRETLGVFILHRTDEKRQNGVRSPEFHWRTSSSLQPSFPGAILQQNGDKRETELSLDSSLLSICLDRNHLFAGKAASLPNVPFMTPPSHKETSIGNALFDLQWSQ